MDYILNIPEVKSVIISKERDNKIDEIECSLNEISNEKLKELVEFADDNNKTINFYDLENDTLLNRAVLKQEGVGSFRQIPFSFTVISPDSILSIEQQPIVYYRIDANANLKEKVEISSKLSNQEIPSSIILFSTTE